MDMLASTDSAGAHQPVNRRLVLASIVGFWLVYFIINTLRSVVIDSGAAPPGEPLRRALVTLAGIILVYLLYLLLRRLEGRATHVLVGAAFLAAVPTALAYALLNYSVFYLLAPLSLGRTAMAHLADRQITPPMIVLDLALSWYFFIASWAVLYVALSYAARVRQAERVAALYRSEAQSAQLRALRYQINPHFLFNTLNALSSLILSCRYDEAEQMILTLATFFRSSLTSDPTDDIALAEEIRLQRLYLEIEQTRFRGRLAVEIDVPSDLEDAAIPGFILQPLVENAIKYGVSRNLRPVTIAIRARAEADQLRLTVEDDGAPTDAIAAGTGVGLANIRNRLAARYGALAGCVAGVRDEGGFRVDLTLPLSRS